MWGQCRKVNGNNVSKIHDETKQKKKRKKLQKILFRCLNETGFGAFMELNISEKAMEERRKRMEKSKNCSVSIW